jgi:acyl carrier protein
MELEEKLKNIYGEILEVKEIGIDDNFFSLGGNSLLVLKLLSAIQSQLGLELDLRIFFENQTVRSLAEVINRGSEFGAGGGMPPIGKRQIRSLYPLTFRQKLFWVGFSPDSTADYIAMVNSLYGPLDMELLKKCIEKVTERHQVLKTKFVQEGGETFQVISDPEVPYFEERDLRQTPDDQLEDAVIEEINRFLDLQLDLFQCPLFRCAFFRTADEQIFFAFKASHLLFDGVSLGIFRDEIKELYSAGKEERSAKLEEIPYQFVDFAIWEQEICPGSLGLKKRFEYWDQLLKGSKSFDLRKRLGPKDRLSKERAYVEHELDQKSFKALIKLSQQNQGTLFTTILMAFALLLERLSGQGDVYFHIPYAQRPPQVGHIMGHFMSILPFRIEVSGKSDVLYQRVKDANFLAQSNLVPGEQLGEALTSESGKSAFGNINVIFNYTMNTSDPLDLPGIQCERTEWHSPGGGVLGQIFFQFMELKEGSRYFISCNDDHFTKADVEKIDALFQTILSEITGGQT